jgi:hypothetical protein
MVKGREWLASFELKKLFIEGLAWDHFRVQPFEVEAEGHSYTVEPVAEKCGFAVFACRPCDGGAMPDYPTRRKVEQRVRRLYHEHFVVFTDGKQSEQKWLWVRREPGKPAVGREYDYGPGKAGDSLLQRISELAVALDEELKGLVITDMVGKVGKGFDRDRVSKRFYERFKDEHAKFLKFLKGIPDEQMERWYVSVMLNRLMFIYFIQKKGFLAGDEDYLKNKLSESKARGRDLYYSDFLCPLFFEGFAKKEDERSPKIRALLGKVPYLNGGIFMPHQIEQQHGKTIEIPDKAFDALFSFFDEYRWHLDERPLKDDKEINPDVLGYIFEKYINQKQMGAYYTKEDITEYIGRNTVGPRLLDMARQKCKVAFEGEQSVWRLLQQNPDRYIFEPVRRGVIDEAGKVIPESKLPDFVQAGMHDPKKRMFDKRYNLGDAELLDDKGDKLTLPTETWREYVARRQRCLELRDKLAQGGVKDVNDLITYNLDIRQFAQDVVEDCDPDLLRAFWRAVEGVSVLDPTCGSGAFLFAALNILEPLYEACLERMRGLLGDLAESGDKHSPKKYGDFRRALDQVGKHPNERYFIFKAIVVKNLFGVDIMDEAVEICKLRLFLKLVAQVDRVEDVEPLPDIDFNIRCGNTLVGYATEGSLADALHPLGPADSREQTGFRYGEHEDALASIGRRLEDLRQALDLFRSRQLETEKLFRVPEEHKREVVAQREALNRELNPYLARWFREENVKKASLDGWVTSHKPFHWIVEFYGIMKSDGFDVIVGNPPFVEWAKIDEYGLPDHLLSTKECGNIYTTMCERSYQLLGKHGRFGMIVPVSSVATDRMQALRNLWKARSFTTWASHYSGDAHPSVLFSGVKFRLSILLQCQSAQTRILSTHFQRWYAEARSFLFPSVSYAPCEPEMVREGLVPKIACAQHAGILRRLCASKPTIRSGILESDALDVYCHRIVAHFVKALDFVPYFSSERDGKKKSEDYKVFPVRDAQQRAALTAVLNSSLFYSWFVTYSDVYHCGREIIMDFPFDVPGAGQSCGTRLAPLVAKLMSDYRANAIRRKIPYRTTGVVRYDEFYPKLSKPIMDEIDQALEKHYGFTDEELDFIINYDIKYRMGRGGGDTGEE